MTKIRIVEHKATGLFTALHDDHPGFIVHAHSRDEMEAKLDPAFRAFLEAAGRPRGALS